MTNVDSTHNVLCFGEVLWDCLPNGRFPGGAPMNVAYHLTKLGCTAWLVSSVGDDPEGMNLLQQLRDWGVRCELVGVDENLQTGIVNVCFANGSPNYAVLENVAWDRIVVHDDIAELCRSPDAIIYGSLAMRGVHNRGSLSRLFEYAPLALKVFDVNLRPPFDDTERVLELASQADIIKVNNEEVSTLLGMDNTVDNFEQDARAIASRFGCGWVCITAGASGAGLLDDAAWYWAQSETVVVNDTVGAGDSFLAGLVAGLLRSADQPEHVLASASRLAAFVASQSGATPDYDCKIVEGITIGNLPHETP